MRFQSTSTTGINLASKRSVYSNWVGESFHILYKNTKKKSIIMSRYYGIIYYEVEVILW